MPFEEWQIDLHGHRAYFRRAGDGPPVVLIHGMVNSSRHWEAVAMRLAGRYTVIAPDLIGHGDSATPRGDYSLGAHAAFIRDLLAVIGIDRASIVGHSLGGGVAMQFFYQFPQRTQRLVLVSSGGLGRDVSPLLRTAALPGAGGALALGTQPPVLAALRRLARELRGRGARSGVYLEAVERALRPLQRPGARKAFLHTLRAVIDPVGQRVSAFDRLYLLEGMPTLVVWGERDRTIPIEHGRATHAAIPDSTFVTLPGVAHFPHIEDPAALAAALDGFLSATEPADYDDARLAEILTRRGGASTAPRAVAGIGSSASP
jgi:pimeloyl-ACP methyl ester carboxylesterase